MKDIKKKIADLKQFLQNNLDRMNSTVMFAALLNTTADNPKEQKVKNLIDQMLEDGRLDRLRDLTQRVTEFDDKLQTWDADKATYEELFDTMACYEKIIANFKELRDDFLKDYETIQELRAQLMPTGGAA